MTAAHDGLILSNILSYTVRKKARGPSGSGPAGLEEHMLWILKRNRSTMLLFLTMFKLTDKLTNLYGYKIFIFFAQLI